MKRFFYSASRAHHANCMAIDFGMKFDRRFGQFWSPEGLLHITGAGGYKIAVAEESVPLLEPQVGDVLLVDGNKLQGVWNDGMRLTIEHSWKRTHPNIDIRIIRRGDSPFYWPELEDM